MPVPAAKRNDWVTFVCQYSSMLNRGLRTHVPAAWQAFIPITRGVDLLDEDIIEEGES